MRWLSGLAALLLSLSASAQDFITLGSTTSTENSGLLAHLLPLFEAETGIEVRVVAVGTGQAMRLGENGDVDVLLVHDRPAEEAFVAAGHGVERRDLMVNDYVLVGPKDDPAGIRGLADPEAALRRLAEAQVPFASRGDDSGTHRAELALWREGGVDPATASGTWYRELGSGMGATLNAAAAMGAYTLADRGTWLGFANKGDLAVLVEGDPSLSNQYGVILVDPERHPHVEAEASRAFADWLVSAEGQAAIAAFTIDGQPLFFPNAGGEG